VTVTEGENILVDWNQGYLATIKCEPQTLDLIEEMSSLTKSMVQWTCKLTITRLTSYY